MINYDVDDKQIQKDLQNLIEKGGLNKKYAKMVVRSASDVIDDQSRKNYANAAYKYGSSRGGGGLAASGMWAANMC